MQDKGKGKVAQAETKTPAKSKENTQANRMAAAAADDETGDDGANEEKDEDEDEDQDEDEDEEKEKDDTENQSDGGPPPMPPKVRSQNTPIWGFQSTRIWACFIDMFFGHTFLGRALIDICDRTSRKSEKIRRTPQIFEATLHDVYDYMGLSKHQRESEGSK